MTISLVKLFVICNSSYIVLAGRSNQPSSSPQLHVPSQSPTGTSSSSPFPQFFNPNSKRKSSFFKIDPKSIISNICKYGGIVLPKTVERDLKILEQTCDCDETSLDLINRNIEIINFTLCLPSSSSLSKEDGGTGGDYKGNKPALRIGRIFIKWDSYMKPCLEIEVDDVDVLVEFVNVILTRNNWYV